MKALLAIALILFASTTVVQAAFLDTFMLYEIMAEGALTNMTKQMKHFNASACVNNTHLILDKMLSFGGGDMLSYLVSTRDLFLLMIDDIDRCPDMMPVITRMIEVFSPLITDPYHFIWKLANNIASNGIDIYFHIGCAVKMFKGLKPTRESYADAGTIFGDIFYDVFFSS